MGARSTCALALRPAITAPAITAAAITAAAALAYLRRRGAVLSPRVLGPHRPPAIKTTGALHLRRRAARARCSGGVASANTKFQ